MVPWMPVGQKMQNIVVGVYRIVHNFLMVVIVSRTYHINYKKVSYEYWIAENVFLKHISCFDILK